MQYVLRLIEQGDVCSLSCLILLFCFVGHFMAAGNPVSYQRGGRIAAVGFIVYTVYGAIQNESPNAEELLVIAFRGLAAAGLLLGISWILLSIGSYLKQQADKQAEQQLAEARRKETLQRQLQRQAEEEERRQLEQEEQKRFSAERIQRQKEKEQREQQHFVEQQQREETRLECQLFYDQHAHQLQNRFSRKQLQEYFTQYLSDAIPLDMHRRRAELLLNLLQTFLDEQQDDARQFKSLNEISAYFQEQRQELATLGYDEETCETLLCSLNQQEDRTIREFLAS